MIEGLFTRSLNVLGLLRGEAKEGVRKGPHFPITRAAELVNRTPAAIRDAEKDGKIFGAVERKASGRRIGYSLAEVNHMREVFGTRPWRAPATRFQ